MARSRTYVGVDIGATKTAAALVEHSGRVLARNRGPTPNGPAAQENFSAVMTIVEELLETEGVDGKDLAAIGVAVPGVVDPRRGTVVVTPNTNLSGAEVIAPLQARFGAPVVLGNDANLGTLGEGWLGAAQDARNVVGIFWGTGIGGGLLLNGELLPGSREVAGEIGHMVMRVNGPRCACGNRGCLEAMAGRDSIERDIRRAKATRGEDDLVPQGQKIKSKMLKKALARGDDVVTRIMTRACEMVGHACLSVRHLLDPDVIVLGGGVIEACGEFAMPIIQEIVKEDTLPGACAVGQVVKSQLGDDAVILGAVALARRKKAPRRLAAKTPRATAYPLIQHVAVGEIVVGQERYESDIYICGNGKVKTCNGKPPKGKRGTSHKIDAEELKKVCRGNPTRLIVGTGHDDSVTVTRDGKRFLEKHGISWQLLPNQEAVQAYNEARGCKAALMRVIS